MDTLLSIIAIAAELLTDALAHLDRDLAFDLDDRICRAMIRALDQLACTSS